MSDICFVDDESELFQPLAHVFEDKFNVSLFDSPEKVLGSITNGYNPDVIVSDLRMPGMDGLALVEALHDRGMSSKIILTSGFADKKDVMWALNRGVYGFLEKPFTAQDLLQIVNSAILCKNPPAIEVIQRLMALNGSLEQLISVYQKRLSMIENLLGADDRRDIPSHHAERLKILQRLAGRPDFLESIELEQNVQIAIARNRMSLNQFLGALRWFGKLAG